MFTTLLPGLREIRSAIASGYLWLLFLWLAVHDALPAQAEAMGVWRTLYDLGSILTPLGYGVVATFAAYLVGSLSEPLFRPLLARLYGLSRRGWLALRRRRRAGPQSRLPAEVPVMNAGELSGAGSHSLANYGREKVNDALAVMHGTSDDDPQFQDQYFQNVMRELRLIERRLIGDQPELHAGSIAFARRQSFGQRLLLRSRLSYFSSRL